MPERPSYRQTWLPLLRSPAFVCLFALQLLLYLSLYIPQAPERTVRYMTLVEDEPPPGTAQVQRIPVPIPPFAGRYESLSGFSPLYRSLVIAGASFNVLPRIAADLVFRPAKHLFVTPRGVPLSECYAVCAILLSTCQWFFLLPLLLHVIRRPRTPV